MMNLHQTLARIENSFFNFQNRNREKYILTIKLKKKGYLLLVLFTLFFFTVLTNNYTNITND